ncbi:serum amyloid A-5 protein-like [Hyperolius riggenbachi]|uniref:serum amyloid A-5 protein-like n=1 Tax=Hyperolius riggenbachi TaxID=752182 RepID=UPI0035A3309A
MRASLVMLLLGLAVAQAQFGWVRNSRRFIKEAKLGTQDMIRAYQDMKKADTKHSDRYFHARGNYDAAQRGRGGLFAAKVISNGREIYNFIKGDDRGDIAADQFANRWGRYGGDPNRFRPKGLPSKY